jgi:hypothetical protein
MTTSLSGVTNDPALSLLISRPSGDGASDRSNVVRSEIEKSLSVKGDSKPLDATFGFDLNLMQPHNILAAVT